MSLEDAIKEIASKVEKFLLTTDRREISIGSFSGQPQLAANAGLGISQSFEKQFKEMGITVKRRAPVGLKGEYLLSSGNEANIELRCSLVDQFGEIISDITLVDVEPGSAGDTSIEQDRKRDHRQPIIRKIDEPSDLAMIGGATVGLDPQDSKESRALDVYESIRDPKFHLDGTVLYAVKDSPFGVEVLLDNQPVPILDDEGLPFVDIPRGKAYSLRIYNASKNECAVVVTIDGLNIFHFSQIRDEHGEPRYRQYVIPPMKSGVPILGWHKTNESVDQFLVTEYAQSAIALANSPVTDQHIGVINVQFSAAWNVGSPPPLDEVLTKGVNATGFGPSIGVKTHEIKKQTGRMRASLSVRYSK